MSAKQDRLARTRALLIARAEEQRAELSAYCRQVEGPARLAGHVFGFFNGLRHSPLLVTGLAAVLLKTPWKKVARLPKLAWRGWRVLQFVRGIVT